MPTYSASLGGITEVSYKYSQIKTLGACVTAFVTKDGTSTTVLAGATADVQAGNQELIILLYR